MRRPHGLEGIPCRPEVPQFSLCARSNSYKDVRMLGMCVTIRMLVPRGGKFIKLSHDLGLSKPAQPHRFTRSIGRAAEYLIHSNVQPPHRLLQRARACFASVIELPLVRGVVGL